jgi:hypothetical protein
MFKVALGCTKGAAASAVEDNPSLGKPGGTGSTISQIHTKFLMPPIEAMHMMRKGQVKKLSGNDAAGQAKFVASLFGIAA